MGSLSILIETLLFIELLISLKTEAQTIKSSRLLDLYIRDYTFKSFNNHIKTGKLHTVHLPDNFTTIKVNTARFRCGSLHRYGAKLNQFHLDIGVTIQPCVERVMLVTQNLGTNWSSIYYANYDLSGYQLISPVLGLLAYNADVTDEEKSRNPFELGIEIGSRPITVDFTATTSVPANLSEIRPLCAIFENDGKVVLMNEVGPYTCEVKKQGHFGLVIETLPPAPVIEKRKRNGWWKMVVGVSVGSGLGLILIGLLIVAVFLKVRKKARMDEVERTSYEEEALQVTMVGHVRAPIATGTRTLPNIEHEYNCPS
ncbi:hypothetical protein ACFE04_016048 [Oxalis oulophora]